MADRKIDRTLFGPGSWEIALGAVLGLLLGLLAAATYLVGKPARMVSVLPREPEPGTVYYVPGRAGAAQGRTWVEKQRQFLAGRRVELTEEELNAWAASLRGPRTSPRAVGIQVLGSPRFRLVGPRLQVSSRCGLHLLGRTWEVTILANGSFVRQNGGRITFATEQLFLGSCPLHRLPLVARLVSDRLRTLESFPTELHAAAQQIGDITLEAGRLQVTPVP